MLNRKIENGYQVIAIARSLDNYVGENSFSNCVCEIIDNGWIDLNESEDTWFDLDYFNDELEAWLNELESREIYDKCLFDIEHILKCYEDLCWRAYDYCFNDELYFELTKRVAFSEKFNKKAVELVDFEFKEMNLEVYDKLFEHFRNEIANSKNLADASYNYNMFAHVFSYIYELKKDCEKDD